MKKTTSRKLLVLFMALVMCFCFTACGGGGSSSEGSGGESAGSDVALTDNLLGVGDVIFNLPEGYAEETAEKTFCLAEKEGSPISIDCSRTTQELIDQWNEEGDGLGAKTLEEYLALCTDPNPREGEEGIDIKTSERDVCGTKGTVVQQDTNGKTFDYGCLFMFKDAVYSMYLYDREAYDDKGNLTKDFVGLSDEDKAMFDAVIASAKEGKYVPTPKRVGDIVVTAPEGFSIYTDEEFCDVTKDDNTVEYFINLRDLDVINDDNDEDGGYDSLEEYIKERQTWVSDDAEPYTICGQDCKIERYEDEENGGLVTYDCEILLGDYIYSFSLNSCDAWDDNGNFKSGAHIVTDEDYAEFKAFLDSLELAQ